MIKAIEPLGKHDRAAFSCGVAALDDWFRLRAGQDEKRNVARVFVAIDDQGSQSCGIHGVSSSFSVVPARPSHIHRVDTVWEWGIGGVQRLPMKFQPECHRVYTRTSPVM